MVDDKKIWNGSQLAIDRYKCFHCVTKILIGLIWTWDILSKLHTSMCDLCKKTHLLSNLSHISKIPCLFLKVKCVIFAMIDFYCYCFTGLLRDVTDDYEIVFYAASLSATIASLNYCLLFILDKIFKTEANTDSLIFSISVISS